MLIFQQERNKMDVNSPNLIDTYTCYYDKDNGKVFIGKSPDGLFVSDNCNESVKLDDDYYKKIEHIKDY